jgi:Cu+-exporting ATPase
MKTLLAVALAAALIGGCDSGRDRSPTPAASPQAKAQDPVCAMMVDKATAKSHEHKGTTYWFCAQECLDKFVASPEKYAK